MGPDPRIADFISANRGRLTREAITQQLREAGYQQEAIDATWTVLDMPDADDQVGQGFWGRFWIYLIGLNVAAFLLVGLATQMLPNATGLAVILGIALAIGGLIALGLVALIHPTRLGRGGAIAIGAIVPLIFTFLIAGSCYALVGAMGPLPPPPLSGTLTLQIDAPLALETTGAASCQQPAQGTTNLTVYTDAPMSSSQGSVHVFVDAYAEAAGGEPVPSVTVSVTDAGPTGQDFIEYQPGTSPSAGIELASGSTATSGSLTFEGFLPTEAFDEEGQPIDRFDADPISGSISWSCEP